MKCEYVSDSEGALGIEAEYVDPIGTLRCSAKGTKVLRMVTAHGALQNPISTGRKIICDAHSIHLCNDSEIKWSCDALSITQELKTRLR